MHNKMQTIRDKEPIHFAYLIEANERYFSFDEVDIWGSIAARTIKYVAIEGKNIDKILSNSAIKSTWSFS